MISNFFDPRTVDVRELRKFAFHGTNAVLTWGKKEFGFDPEMPCKITIDCIPLRDQTSYAGCRMQHTADKVTTSGNIYLKLRRVARGNWSYFNEYDHIGADPDIGHAICSSWEEYVMILICHEVAHVLEHTPGWGGTIPKEASRWGSLPPKKAAIDGEHGPRWQTIYRRLRNQFVAKELFQLPEEKLSAPKISKGKVLVRHGFTNHKFIKGEFELMSEFEPTPEAVLNNEKYGLPLNVGYLTVRSDDGVMKIEVDMKDFEYV